MSSNESPIGTVTERPLEDEMKVSYLDYAMSVIVSRALPDVRDGLKPVHRRILWAMWKLGLKSNARFRKSATVVGEVLGKYHPHGDAAVYDTLARMAQDFSMREVLIIGQGNFGSVDGDAPAAMRYTEAKLALLAEALLQDIEKETVPFRPNYDDTQEEPEVLPAKFPNLLVNGSTGIAVGMATSIPPHNLGEVCAAVSYLIDHPDATVDDLIKVIPGPDFPTGGLIYNGSDIRTAYATGKGSVVMRARAEILEDKGESRIVITELPYQVNKAELIAHIATLVRDKKIEGIRDLRDESDKDGLRVVVLLKKDAYPKKVLNRLFVTTGMQTTFHVNMLALTGGIQPRVLNLKEILSAFVTHREEVVRKRSEFDLRVAKDRAHVLEGLRKALDNLDAVITTIKRSEDREDAKRNLMKRFAFTERQAHAILEMRLAQLAHLEREKILEEERQVKARIKELETILSSKKNILAVVKKESAEVSAQSPHARKTELVSQAVGEFRPEDLIPNVDTVVMVTRDGYVKRLEPSSFRRQSRGGKGVVGLTTKEEDEVSHFFITSTHAKLMFFTTRGRVFQLPAYEVAATSRGARGQSLANFLELSAEEKVSVVFPLDARAERNYLVMVTVQGVIKKVEAKDFVHLRRSGLIALSLKGTDQLRWVRPSSGKDDLLLVTRGGKSIRFPERLVRPMGRMARGVRGIRLGKGDAVVGMDVVPEGKNGTHEVLVVGEQGLGKRTPLSEYRKQGRGGSGIKTAAVSQKTGQLAAAFLVDGNDTNHDLIIISSSGQVIRMSLASVRQAGRATQGVRLMRFKETREKVASVTVL